MDFTALRLQWHSDCAATVMPGLTRRYPMFYGKPYKLSVAALFVQLLPIVDNFSGPTEALVCVGLDFRSPLVSRASYSPYQVW